MKDFFQFALEHLRPIIWITNCSTVLFFVLVIASVVAKEEKTFMKLHDVCFFGTWLSALVAAACSLWQVFEVSCGFISILQLVISSVLLSILSFLTYKVFKIFEKRK